MSDALHIAIEAAKVGAKTALSYFETNLTASYKEDSSIVTIADKETEKSIIEYITAKDPSASFVAEESGGVGNKDAYWIIDPIDGTRSFFRGINSWAILIAYCVKEEIQVGVCYFPSLNTMITAERGKGTYVDGKKVHVSKISDIKKAYINFGSLHYFKNRWEDVARLTEAVGSARSFEATYTPYLVAQGKMEAAIDLYAKLWDAAPFKVIIEEAGGTMTQPDGKPWTTQSEGYVTTNGLLHDEIIRIFNQKS